MSYEHYKDSMSRYTSQFPRSFWLINGLELIERGAYYGTMAILAIHIHDNLDFSATITGMLTGTLMGLLYFVPLVAAALAEKIGYRKSLIAAFMFMICGYVTFGFVSDLALVFISILLLGIGAGAFKPLVSATIAHVTEPEQRNAGFSIYYWMINLGAFMVPLIIGGFKSLDVFDPEKNSEIVFFMSSILITINLIIAFFKVEEPITPDPDKDIFASLRTLVTVFDDKSFMYLLIIYSGFWFMFGTAHIFMPLYMKHFHIMPEWFSVFYLACINPGTIISVGFILSKIVDKYDSLHLMITGVSIFVLGVLMLGLTAIPILFVGGIIVFSFGEFITHPNFISYVSKIAPKDKVAIYMGYSFIPMGIGQVCGNFIGGFLFGHFAETEEMPKIFWAIVASYGLLTITGLVLYDNWMAKMRKLRADETVAESWDDESWDHYEEPERKPSPININIPFITESRYVRFLPAVVAILLIPIIIGSATTMGSNTWYEEDDDDVYYTESPFFLHSRYDDFTEENDETSWPVEIETEGISRFEFSLTWEDEDDASADHHNDPDRFEFSVETPWQVTYDSEAEENQHGSEHTITFNLNINDTDVEKKETNKAKTSGQYFFTVRCLEAGDQQYTGINPLEGDEPDDGNDWTFDIKFSVWERHEKD